MKLNILFFLALILNLTGCADSLNHLAYHPDIPQGNIITSEQIQQLKVGFTQTDVIRVMGTPLLRDPFHADRWDYIHRTTTDTEETTQTQLVLYFDAQQKLTKIEKKT